MKFRSRVRTLSNRLDKPLDVVELFRLPHTRTRYH
jgi:hypothetical protein